MSSPLKTEPASELSTMSWVKMQGFGSASLNPFFSTVLETMIWSPVSFGTRSTSSKSQFFLSLSPELFRIQFTKLSNEVLLVTATPSIPPTRPLMSVGLLGSCMRLRKGEEKKTCTKLKNRRYNGFFLSTT